MSKITETQEVKLFIDENVIGKQEVYIDTDDESEVWVNVIHAGAEISLSLTNWNKLVELAKKAESQINIPAQQSF